MEQPILSPLFLLAGFYLLSKAADWLVSGSAEIARGLRVPPLIVGLTVVAWGTSAPEVVVSMDAALKGKAGLSLGNALGSNVANIALVLGACGVVLPTVLRQGMRLREVFWLLASVSLVWALARDGEITRLDGAVLLVTFVLYNLHLIFTTARGETVEGEPEDACKRPVLYTLLGLFGITLAARLVVMGAVDIATAMGMSEREIGLTIVAIGTSLPELAAGLGGALKGHADISLGNVVGSNVFNVLAVLGLVAVVAPLGGAANPDVQQQILSASNMDFPVVLGVSLAIVLLPRLLPNKLARGLGATFLLGYLGYLGFVAFG